MGGYRLYKYSFSGIIILVAALSSCISQREIVVDLYQPPQVSLHPSQDTLTVLHRVSVEDRDSLPGGNQNPGGRQEEGIRVVAGRRAVAGFLHHLLDEDLFVLSGNIEWLDSLRLNTDTFPPPLSWKVIKRFCDEKKSNLLVSLEAVDYHTDLQYSTYQRRTHESRNKVWSKTILYNVQYEIMQKADFLFAVNTVWRVYDPAGQRLVLERKISDSIVYEVDGETREIVEKKLPSYGSAAERAGYVAGEHFARIILPSYRTVVRYYYGGGTKAFREATTFVRFRNWEEALKIWKKLLEVSRPALQARIWYNLALVSEMNGKPEEAITFLERAYETHPDAGIVHYRNTIINTWALEKNQM